MRSLISLVLRATVNCPVCGGSGKVGNLVCNSCGGRGQIGHP